MNPQHELAQIVREALTATFPAAATTLALPTLVQSAQDPRFGDYQTNAAMPLAKSVGRPPREIAAELSAAIQAGALSEPVQIAGPGFINFKLTSEYLGRQVAAIAADPVRAGVDVVTAPQTVVLEYSSPNVAKRLHVGHLRSTILGDAMYRLMGFLGHHVKSDNHVGDWGTQFGLLMVAYRRWADPAELAADPVGVLESLYQRGSAAAKADPALADEARAELAKLQAGDPENRALWEEFVSISRKDVEGIYALLDVSFDFWHGESFYEPFLHELVKRLEDTGVAVPDQGALVVFFPEIPSLAEKPFIVRKQDGAFLYSSTDIATVEYRLREWAPDRVLYFVDRRQALHFEQLFATVKRMGLAVGELEHVGFGSIMNAEGKPLKTRDGATPSLRGLLEEAVSSARKLVETTRPDLTPEQLAHISHAVGVGAVKYFDLGQNRNTDYKFDLEKMIAFDGNTGPYLQYMHARICSIFRKLEGAPWTPPASVVLEHADELALARQLVRYEEVLLRASEAIMPNYLCEHLYAVARAYASFYASCRVLDAEGATRDARLSLCRAAQAQLATGLRCLGIEPLEVM